MEDKLVTLVIYRYDYRAQILKAKLEEEGINCAVSEKSVFGEIDGVKVMVMHKDMGKAIKIYQEVRELYDDHSDDVIEETEDF